MVPGGRVGPQLWDKFFILEYIEKIFLKISFKNYLAKEAQVKMGESSDSVDSSLFK